MILDKCFILLHLDCGGDTVADNTRVMILGASERCVWSEAERGKKERHAVCRFAEYREEQIYHLSDFYLWGAASEKLQDNRCSLFPAADGQSGRQIWSGVRGLSTAQRVTSRGENPPNESFIRVASRIQADQLNRRPALYTTQLEGGVPQRLGVSRPDSRRSHKNETKVEQWRIRSFSALMSAENNESSPVS